MQKKSYGYFSNASLPAIFFAVAICANDCGLSGLGAGAAGAWPNAGSITHSIRQGKTQQIIRLDMVSAPLSSKEAKLFHAVRTVKKEFGCQGCGGVNVTPGGRIPAGTFAKAAPL